MKHLDRRAILGAIAAAPCATAARGGAPERRMMASTSAQTRWSPAPPPVGREIMVDVGGVQLWCLDTGGSGPAIVLLHAATGSGASWGYQQAALVGAGFRVIAYSRRGHYRSDAGPKDATGTIAGDLHGLITALGLAPVHLLGTAMGGFGVPDFALSYPGMVGSIIVASSLAGIAEPDFTRVTKVLIPADFYTLPAAFRELGPCYRAANPAGVAAWAAIERQAVPGDFVEQSQLNVVDWAALRALACPMLFVTGDADLYLPPARLREIGHHVPAARYAIIAEAGHAAYWEQPDAFNRIALEFLRHGA